MPTAYVNIDDKIKLTDITDFDKQQGFKTGEIYTVAHTANNEAYVYVPNQNGVPNDQKEWWAFTADQFKKVLTDIPHKTHSQIKAQNLSETDHLLFKNYEAAQTWFIESYIDLESVVLAQELPSDIPNGLTFADWLMIDSNQFFFTEDGNVLFIYQN